MSQANATKTIRQRLEARCQQTVHKTLQEKPPTRPSGDEVSKDTGVHASQAAAGHGHVTGHGTA